MTWRRRSRPFLACGTRSMSLCNVVRCRPRPSDKMDAAGRIADGRVSAGFAAVIAAVFTGRLPRWLRIVLVAGLVALACGARLFGYRHSTQPITLTVAVGSLDGSASHLMSALAAQLASTGAPVRLKVVERETVLEATKSFAAGQADLAIARDDVGDLSNAQTVVVLTRGVVLLIAPPGTSMTSRFCGLCARS
jgi:hypothetical protein